MKTDRIARKLDSLRHSAFRVRFALSMADLAYIDQKGLTTITRHAFDFITSRIAPRFPINDGRQTPMKNHPVFIAQHATATCCRNCIRKWHNIPKGRALTGVEIDYIVCLVMEWIRRQRVKGKNMLT